MNVTSDRLKDVVTNFLSETKESLKAAKNQRDLLFAIEENLRFEGEHEKADFTLVEIGHQDSAISFLESRISRFDMALGRLDDAGDE